MTDPIPAPTSIVIIGGGPTGLFAATQLQGCGHTVHIYDRKPTLARKFLMAGRGGLNLTHSENIADFMSRYGKAAAWMKPHIEQFTPDDLRRFADGLGQETFIGSSGRVFPKRLKASPMLRAWQQDLSAQDVVFHPNHEWRGWNDNGDLVFESAGQIQTVTAAATLLAMGGASWPKLGSDGGWTPYLREKNIALVPFAPANCGFTVGWSDYFITRFAGQPLKTIALCFGDKTITGDITITAGGVEGGAVYALAAALRDAVPARVHIDLRPALDHAGLNEKLSAPRQGRTLTNHLRKSIGLNKLAAALMYEGFGREKMAAAQDSATLAAMVKAVPVTLTAPAPIDRAISSAGGIALGAVDNGLMIRGLPGVFAAGEMLDWEAPTGGYLLQGCFSTGFTAARGIKAWLARG